MTKMAQLAQQRLTERYTNKRYQETVEEKAKKTEENVKAIDAQIMEIAAKNN